MSVTIDLDDNECIRLTDIGVRRRAPDQLEFSVEGNLTVTDALLAEFKGATLDPVGITVSAEDVAPIAIDLTDSASLRLENVDVGVATPDRDDIAAGIDTVRPSTDGGPAPVDSPPDVLSFTVDGVVRDVSPGALEPIADEAPRLESLTFAVDESLRSDGGRGSDVVCDLTLFGFGVVVHRDGRIVVCSGLGAGLL